MKKQTLYELLGVPPHALDTEIRAAYMRESKRLDESELGPLHELTITKQKVLQQAYETLSIPSLRAAYDAKLFGRTSALDVLPTDEIQHIARFINPDKAKLPFKLLGGILLIMVILQFGNQAYFSHQRAAFIQAQEIAQTQQVENSSEVEDKLYLQNFYERTGIRAASRTEADLIERQQQQDRYEQERLQREKEQQAREQKRLLDQAHWEGEQVSAQLRYAEQMQKAKDEQEQRRIADEQRRQKEMERMKIEQEKMRYKAILSGGYR